MERKERKKGMEKKEEDGGKNEEKRTIGVLPNPTKRISVKFKDEAKKT